MHTLKIGVLDVSGVDGFSFELFRQVAYPRLMALAPLRYQLVDIPMKLHHPMWVENDDIELDYHLRQVRVPAPGGRRELDALIGEIASTPLDRGHPLWEMYLAEGLAGNRVAIIHKVHHVLADGVASANQMAKAMGPHEPGDVPSPTLPVLPRNRSSLLKAAGRDHVGLIRKLPRLVSETATGVSRVRRRSKERGAHPDLARHFSPPSCFINHVVTPGRRFATAPLALADVTETSKHLGVTLNDDKTRIVHVSHGFEFLGYKIKRGSRRLSLPSTRIRSGTREGDLYAYPREKSIQHFKEQIRGRTRRKAEINPVIRGWGFYFCKAHVRKLFARLDRWILRRLWSQRLKRWRNRGWTYLPERRLYGAMGLVRLVFLIPSLNLR